MKRNYFAAIFLTLIFLPLGAAVSAQTVEILIKNAEAAIEKRDYEGALNLLDSVLAKQPNNPEALLQQGRVWHFQGKNAEALAAAEKAIAANPVNSPAYNLRGLAKWGLGTSVKEIEEDFNKAIEIDPKNYKPRLNRGRLRADYGTAIDALSDYNKAVELAPQIPVLYSSRAQLYAKVRYFAAAEKDADKAVSLAPNSAEYYANRAEIYWKQMQNTKDGFGEKVKADAEKAIVLDPKLWSGYYYRGYAKLNEYNNDSGAFADFMIGYQLTPAPQLEAALLANRWKFPLDGAAKELFKKLLEKRKAMFEKNFGNSENQALLTWAFGKNEAQGKNWSDEYQAYLNSLFAKYPQDHCLIFYAYKDNYKSRTKIFLDALKINYNVKNAQCVAGMADTVAYDYYDAISRMDLKHPDYENYFSTSLFWAVETEKIVPAFNPKRTGNLSYEANQSLKFMSGTTAQQNETLRQRHERYKRAEDAIEKIVNDSFTKAEQARVEKHKAYEKLRDAYIELLNAGKLDDDMNRRINFTLAELILICEKYLENYKDLLSMERQSLKRKNFEEKAANYKKALASGKL